MYAGITHVTCIIVHAIGDIIIIISLIELIEHALLTIDTNMSTLDNIQEMGW